jgi:hypothetical protein
MRGHFIIGILFRPQDTWDELKDESITFSRVLTNYAVPLATIPAFFGMCGYVIVGIRSGFGNVVYRIPFGIAFLWAVIYYILLLTGLYAVGIAINALTRIFDSRHDALRAFKVSVFSYTPVFLAGVLYIIPTLGFVVFLISIYSVYLLYHGLRIMMETPHEKTVPYLLSTVLVMFVVYMLLGAFASVILTLH